MNWNDYEALWKRQELPIGEGADVAELRRTFETKRRKLAKTLQARDYLESAAGLFVAAVFTKVWWHMGREGWPIGLAIVLILGVAVFFLCERVRAHRLRLGPEATLLAKLEAELAELRHQRQLLLSVRTWYLAPCAGAMALFCLAMARKMIRDVPSGFFTLLMDHPIVIAWIAGYFLVLVPLLFWGIWAMNRRVVHKNIEPRIAELEKLCGDLQAAD